jgi:hypothetical protein
MASMPDAPAESTRRRWTEVPFHPVLFAAYPILFLFSQNLGGVLLGDLFVPLALAMGAALIAQVALTLVLRDAQRAAILVSGLVLALLAYGHAARVASSFHLGPGRFPFVLGAVLVALVAFAFLGRRWLPTVNRALGVIAVVLVGLQLVAIIPYEARSMTAARAQAAGSVAGGSGHTTRDIYYIILDRYGSARSLALNYGITDDGFYGWLADHGFVVAADSHANYGRTSLSLAATLNMTFLDAVAAQQGPDSSDEAPIDAMLQDHAVGRFLKSEGYRYIHVGSYYNPTRTSSIANANMNLGGASDFAAGVYDETALPVLARRLGLAQAAPQRQRHADQARHQIEVLHKLRTEPGPKFVFAHLLLPHPPYVFAPDGTFRPDPSDGPPSATAQFHDQLEFTDRQMEAIIEPLVALPEAERPIIIVQADEGPYPPPYAKDTIHYDWATATPDELEIKFGILNAMFLPGIDPSAVPQTISSVNTFRLLFDRYFGADLPLLPDRSYTSAAKFRPYDFTDITGRLPTLK